MASDRLNIRFSPESPYKLCDLKPFLPIIHSDLLKEYDYVGFGDIDLIYGDLSGWLRSIDPSKELISTHTDRISGHFTLLKNRMDVLEKAYRIPRWKKLLEDNRHYGLDEGLFSRAYFYFLNRLSGLLLYRLKMPAMNRIACSVLRHLYPKYHLKEMKTTPIPRAGETWEYRDGQVHDPHGTSLPYIHFLFFKKTQYYPENKNYWKDGFYKIDTPVDSSSKPILIDINGISYGKQNT